MNWILFLSKDALILDEAGVKEGALEIVFLLVAGRVSLPFGTMETHGSVCARICQAGWSVGEISKVATPDPKARHPSDFPLPATGRPSPAMLKPF